MNDRVERLTAGLDDEQRQSLGDLQELADLLARDEGVLEPGPRDHARLLAAIQTHLPPDRAREPLQGARGPRGWLALAWSQAALLQAPYWWAGGLVFLLGLAAAAVEGGSSLTLVFVLLTPVLAAGGVAYAFRPETRTLWELERLTSVGVTELLYARLMLVLAFDGLLSLTLLGVIWVRGPQLVLWRLLLVWLGPMLTLAGIGLYTTLRWGPTAGAVLPLSLWGTFVLMAWWQAMVQAMEVQSAVAWLLAQINGSTMVVLTCVLSAALGLVLIWESGRLVRRKAWA